jgi:hypothetical protein
MPLQDLLQHPRFRAWLGGVEPAWSLLDVTSLLALVNAPVRLDRPSPIRLAVDFTADEVAASPAASHMLKLLRMADEADGLKLTATGNLTRAVVADFAAVLDWPGFDLAMVRRICKVIREADVQPLQFLRLVAMRCGFLRRTRNRLVLTKAGRQMFASGAPAALQAIVFHAAFWRTNLAFFDGAPLPEWPQSHIGVVLWSLAAAANSWQSDERLVRLCAIPDDAIIDAPDRFAPFALEFRVLRTLLWFGLMERDEAREDRQRSEVALFRKTPLYDRFIGFKVRLEEAGAGAPRH